MCRRDCFCGGHVGETYLFPRPRRVRPRRVRPRSGAEAMSGAAALAPVAAPGRFHPPPHRAEESDGQRPQNAHVRECHRQLFRPTFARFFFEAEFSNTGPPRVPHVLVRSPFVQPRTHLQHIVPSSTTPSQHVPFVIAIFTAGDVVGRYLPNLIGSIPVSWLVPCSLARFLLFIPTVYALMFVYGDRAFQVGADGKKE